MLQRIAIKVLLCCWVTGLVGLESQPSWARVPIQEPGEQASLGAQDVPPEVLRAIYPQRSSTVEHNFSDEPQTPEASYFDQAQSTPELQIGSSDGPAQPNHLSQFNENLFGDTAGTGPARSPSPTQPAVHPVARHPAEATPDLLAELDVPNRTLMNSPVTVATLPNRSSHSVAVDQVNSTQFDQAYDPSIAPASHLVDVEPASQRVAPRHLRSVPQPQEPVPYWGSPQTQPYSEATQDPDRDSSVALPAQSRSGRTLADLLADSNQNVSTARGEETRKKPLDSAAAGEVNEGWRGSSSAPLTDTLQRIAISLCLVLAVAFVCLITVKRWLLPGKPSSRLAKSLKVDRGKSNIQILSQLKLDARSLLYLVQANEHQVLVAVDPTGIKSVVTLQADFGSTLEDLSATNEPAIGASSFPEIHAQDRRDFNQILEDRKSSDRSRVDPSSQARSNNSRASLSIFQELEAELGQPVLYTPASVYAPGSSGSRSNSASRATTQTGNSAVERATESDIELEMKRKLAELLRGSLAQSQK